MFWEELPKEQQPFIYQTPFLNSLTLPSLELIMVILVKLKQAGTGPSRRHIQGSKIAKRLPSVKYSFTVLDNRNFLKKNFWKKLHTQKNGPSGAPGLASASPWRAKVSQCRKTERGDPLGFFNIHSVAKHQKNAWGTLWGKIFFRKKSLAVPKKNERGESLVSPGMACYAVKQEKPFWFSSLDQIVHFDAIIFCRTFVELFWSVRVDRKKKSHYNSRVSLHEAPTKNTIRLNYLLIFMKTVFTCQHTPQGELFLVILTFFKK